MSHCSHLPHCFQSSGWNKSSSSLDVARAITPYQDPAPSPGLSVTISQKGNQMGCEDRRRWILLGFPGERDPATNKLLNMSPVSPLICLSVGSSIGSCPVPLRFTEDHSRTGLQASYCTAFSATLSSVFWAVASVPLAEGVTGVNCSCSVIFMSERLRTGHLLWVGTPPPQVISCCPEVSSSLQRWGVRSGGNSLSYSRCLWLRGYPWHWSHFQGLSSNHTD